MMTGKFGNRKLDHEKFIHEKFGLKIMEILSLNEKCRNKW